jgi:NodT family efflux transporter outer membrane factor (OMF) lipoprotein
MWPTGCAVGPDYHRPELPTPAVYGEAMTRPTSQPATTQLSTVDPGRPTWVEWWTKFNDPELNSLVARALTANHELIIARARVVEARAVERVAESAYYPTIDLSAAFAKSRGSAGAFGFPYGIPGADRNLYQIGFDATYEVDLFGGIRRSVEAAGAVAQATEDERRAVQVTLLGEVARSYIGLRALQRRLSVARANLEDQRRTLDIVRRRMVNGLAANFDVVRARAQVAATDSAIPPLEAGIRQTVHSLSVLLGEPPMALSGELEADAPIPPVPPSVPVGLPSELLRRRPDVMRAERVLAAATAEQGIATADLFPHLLLGGTAGVQSTHADQLFNQHGKSSGFYLAGPAASWTIFDGGRRWANVDRSKARVWAAATGYEAAVLQALRDVESSLTAYSHDQARRDTLMALAAEDQEAVRIARSEYAQGLIDLLDVIEVQRNLYAAQDALAQADQAVSSDLVSLYKALGGGWESPDAASPPRDPPTRPVPAQLVADHLPEEP